jgi:hypothetical protein
MGSMNFFSRVLRFLFWLIVLSWGVRLLRYFFSRRMRPAEPSAATQEQRGGVDVAENSEAVGPARRLVRDPVCGVHVAEVLAIPLREGTQTVHFCSVACRDQYAASHRLADKLAASG